MIKRMLFIILIVGLTALAGCHTGASTSVRADYYSGGRYAPYGYYDPFYPRYFYDPYPSFFFGSSFYYGYTNFYPYYPYYYPYGRVPSPGSRSLRGFNTAPHWNGSTGSGGMRGPSSGGSTGGGSGGGRSLR